jgi:DMSO/TMAO reductase YedYZ molybdopterin-dependent catalytic subunit
LIENQPPAVALGSTVDLTCKQLRKIGSRKGEQQVHRRDLLQGGAVASVAILSRRAFAQTAPIVAKLVPWSDQPPPVPAPVADNVIRGLARWEDLNSWITPNDKFFGVAHYGWPTIDETAWRLNVSGSVVKPASLTLTELKAMPRHEVISTIECSGSNGFPFNPSMIGNANWAGVSLAQFLRNAQIKGGAVEVVFYGADRGEDVAHRGMPYELTYTDTFTRSMSIDDAMNPANLLCYEMNGSPLPARNGFPVRLIAPGWYGIANVKWLSHIEVRDTRYVGRFMGREYITLREVQQDGQPVITATPVGRMLLKSAPALVTQRDAKYQIDGMAWGPNVAAVEVKIDNGPWTKAVMDTSKSEFAWRSWHTEASLAAGDHTVTSRAIDTAGKIQPAMDDPFIAKKKTYWESNGQITRHFKTA